MKRRAFIKNLGIVTAGVPVSPVLGEPLSTFTSEATGEVWHGFGASNRIVSPTTVANEMFKDWEDCVEYVAGELVRRGDAVFTTDSHGDNSGLQSLKGER